MRTFPLWSRCLHSEQPPGSSRNPQHLLYLTGASKHPGSCRASRCQLPSCAADERDKPALPFCWALTAGLGRPGEVGSQRTLLLLGRGEEESRDPEPRRRTAWMRSGSLPQE